MKKILFICYALSLFGSTSPMKRISHPCLPLEFYKHALGFIVRNAQSNPELNSALFTFMDERKTIIDQLLKDEKPFGLEKVYPAPGAHAYELSEKLRKNGMKDKELALWNYGCISSDLLRYAIRKNLGIESERDPWFEPPLFSHETWPMKVAPEQEVRRQFHLYYSNSKIFDLARIIEERSMHTVMKHFLQNPEIIQGRHIARSKD